MAHLTGVQNNPEISRDRFEWRVSIRGFFYPMEDQFRFGRRGEPLTPSYLICSGRVRTLTRTMFLT